MKIGIDDILAALLLSLIMYRRLEVLSVREQDNPHVSPERFRHWRASALSGYNLGAIACLLKVVLNIAWFGLSRGNPTMQVVGGLSLFVGWIIAIVFAWRRTTEANVMRREYGILRRHEASPPR